MIFASVDNDLKCSANRLTSELRDMERLPLSISVLYRKEMESNSYTNSLFSTLFCNARLANLLLRPVGQTPWRGPLYGAIEQYPREAGEGRE